MGRVTKVLLTIAFLFGITLTVNAQKQWHTTVKGQIMGVERAQYFDVSKPLTQMQPIKGWVLQKKEQEHEIPNHFLYKLFKRVKNTPDPLSQRFMSAAKASSATILEVFSGAKNTDNASKVAPPDTQGDIGPDYYVQAVNNVTAIYDRKGNLVWGPKPTSTFWDGFQGPWTGTNDGDAIVLYDEHAKRWLISQFAVNTSDGTQYELVAISKTSDPTGSYYRYAFKFQYMPDYPKIGVWPDGYYFSANAFDQNGNFQGTYVAVFQRDKMLQGDPNAQMLYALNSWSSTHTFAFLPADADVFPPAGTPCYFVYDQDDNTYWSSDAINVWAFHVDWTNTSNSTFKQVASLTPASFNSSFSSGVPQKGTTQTLDLLNDRMMFRAYFRPFSDHNSLVLARTVNDGGVAAIRWYELRDNGNGWYIYQQGTYNPGDGLWRWMPSIAMNANGDIALGYSVSSSNMYPSIRVTGRHASDPKGEMTIAETSIFEGSAAQTGASRWGDYAMMSVDPTDNTTFWFTTEYSTGGWDWATKIASFTLGQSSSDNNGGGTTCQAPQITSQPQSVQTCSGQTVTFSVKATGTNLKYQWRKDGANISGATSSTLTLTNVTTSDEGKYDCVVSNDCGSVTSNAATLTVSGQGVTITSQPQDITASYGSDVTFSVKATGTNLKYQWYKNGTALSDNDWLVGTHSSSLTIYYVINSDEGQYYCVISSDCGSAETRHATLTVTGGYWWWSQNKAATRTTVYPNPFTDRFTLTVANRQLPAKVIIRDLSGRVLMEKDITNAQNVIDLSQYQGNMFIVEVKGHLKTEHFKVVRK